MIARVAIITRTVKETIRTIADTLITVHPSCRVLRMVAGCFARPIRAGESAWLTSPTATAAGKAPLGVIRRGAFGWTAVAGRSLRFRAAPQLTIPVTIQATARARSPARLTTDCEPIAEPIPV